MVRRRGERMIFADAKENGSAELGGIALYQFLEFVMITKALRESFPETIKEELPKAFELAMTVDDDRELSEKLCQIVCREEDEN